MPPSADCQATDRPRILPGVALLRALRTSLLVVAVTLLLLEIGLRATGVHRALVGAALYYQTFDLPVHRTSADRELRYELSPGASHDFDDGTGRWSVHVDRFGARGRERAEPRPYGTFRIVMLGGSTTYGFKTLDDETLPARLEQVLAAHAPVFRSFEVLNFGRCAYVMTQVERLGESVLATYTPDLLVVQVYNAGRRPFLAGPGFAPVDFTPWLDDDDTILENFDAPPGVPRALHASLVRRVVTWRTAAALWRRWTAPKYGMNAASDYADLLGRRAAARLVEAARAKHVPIVFVTLPGTRTPPSMIGDGLREADLIRLHQPGREPAFYDVHPPPAVLAEWATSLADELARRGLVPVAWPFTADR